MKTAIFRKEHFNAAHRLFNSAWTDEQNNQVFGKCNNPNYHGHNYELIVKLIGEVDPVTGYVFDTKVLSDLIKKHILSRYDHKNLNLDCEEFKHLNPTAENIAHQIYKTLRSLIEPSIDLKVILYETERNFVEYPA
ncbi:6-pyruvoyl trahydropterin synthase family protein [Cytophaga aurantiaca]|uniref:6-pyruvoyl trahydropterin synthase family protein n=1 Tax=Cytophaga aurantiaca TaxID=29530 RepID=UPI00037A057A|nr:6-carboxytetrahydropterin synthase [Cytophaga aurantiaca]